MQSKLRRPDALNACRNASSVVHRPAAEASPGVWLPGAIKKILISGMREAIAGRQTPSATLLARTSIRRWVRCKSASLYSRSTSSTPSKLATTFERNSVPFDAGVLQRAALLGLSASIFLLIMLRTLSGASDPIPPAADQGPMCVGPADVAVLRSGIAGGSSQNNGCPSVLS